MDMAFQTLEKKITAPLSVSNVNDGLEEVLKAINGDLLRFRNTRKTRKFNIEDVEFFSLGRVLYFYIHYEQEIFDLEKIEIALRFN